MIKYFIGYSAVGVAGISLLPQIYQIIKTKRVEDLNRTYFLLCIIGEFLYATYGFLEGTMLWLHLLYHPSLMK